MGAWHGVSQPSQPEHRPRGVRRITELSVVHVLRQFDIDEYLTRLVRSHRRRARSGRFSHLQETLYGTSFDLSKVGYEKSQFFLSGTAHSYVPAQPLTSDGKWKDRDWREHAVHDTDSRLPSDQPKEVQRDSRGRVAQCDRLHGRRP